MGIQHAYNDWSQIYDTNKNLTRDLDHKVTRETLDGHRYNSILEIGCGTGKNTAFLVRVGYRVNALDFSEGMIGKAKQRVQAGNVRFEMADITKPWPCDNKAYDLITCNLVLEHIEELTHIFSEAVRTITPNGRFLINELHPFKQYQGTKARFKKEDGLIEVDAFVHHISEFINTAKAYGLNLFSVNEFWHEADQGKPPRLVSLVFEKP